MVAELLGLETGDRHAPLLVAPAEARRRLLAALSGWLSDTARQQPVVLVLEDLQWMDPSTTELLDILADQAAAVPLLILGTARREFQPSWRPRAHHLELTLQRLTAAQTRRVVSLVAAKSARGDPPAEGTAATAPSLLDLLAERADGVPLFAEELTRAVVDAQRRQDLDIPMTLHDSLMARLDALGPAKELAQVASVVGRKFSHALLRAVTGLDADLLGRHLDRIVDAEIVSVRGVPPDAVYTFRHALVRDAAYDSLLKRRRRELHHAIADTLREKDREAAGTPPELVAFHYVEAGLIAEAIPHLRRAGERAVASAANREAVQHLTRALDLLATLPASPERDTIELSLLLPLGVAWMAVQGMPRPRQSARSRAPTRSAAAWERHPRWCRSSPGCSRSPWSARSWLEPARSESSSSRWRSAPRMGRSSPTRTCAWRWSVSTRGDRGTHGRTPRSVSRAAASRRRFPPATARVRSPRREPTALSRSGDSATRTRRSRPRRTRSSARAG
jgi:predicted ATPase